MFSDVVPMDVNFWKLKERHSREKKTLTVLNTVDAASGMHIASKSDISHAVGRLSRIVGFVGASAAKCLRVDPQAEGRGIFVDPVLAEAHKHMEASREPCEISSHDGKPNNGRLGH